MTATTTGSPGRQAWDAVHGSAQIGTDCSHLRSRSTVFSRTREAQDYAIGSSRNAGNDVGTTATLLAVPVFHDVLLQVDQFCDRCVGCIVIPEARCTHMAFTESAAGVKIRVIDHRVVLSADVTELSSTSRVSPDATKWSTGHCPSPPVAKNQCFCFLAGSLGGAARA